MTGLIQERNDLRYEFGANWAAFIEKNFSQERVDISKQKILEFISRQNLQGLGFLDIGCGSGLHSLAAWQAGAATVHSFDYDINSVKSTAYLHSKNTEVENWQVEQASVLDEEYMRRLPKYDLVYSWGVLHHTGDVWQAIRNAAIPVKLGGQFFIALYSADAHIDPSPEFWLNIKRKYVKGNQVRRWAMELWYIWRFGFKKNLLRAPSVLKKTAEYKKNRGMSKFTDMRDWLGGWPMEFVYDAQVTEFCQKLGFRLDRISTGQANTEFLFTRVS